MAGGKGNIDAISVSLGADLKQLRSDLRAAKTELDKALPTQRTVHVSVGVDTPKNAVSDLYQNIQGQFQEFQKNSGQALRIAPRMTVDPRVMRDFRRDLERNMMQAGRSGQAVRVPIKFNGDIKAFIASIGHVEVPVYGRWAGWSSGGGPPDVGGSGGGGGGAPHGPRGVPGRGPGGRSGPAGGGPAPEPARGRPATGTQARGATGGTVVPPHTYAGSGGRRDDASSDRYSIEEDPGAFVPRGSPVSGEFVSRPAAAPPPSRPPTPRQQRQATRRAAMSGAAPPPARRPGLSVPARGDPTRPSDRPYEAPAGGRVDMASVRGGSAEVELQGEERAAYIAQQAETRSRRNFAPNTAPQVRSGGRPTTPRAIERLERRRRYQASVQRGMSPQDAAAREHVRSGFHTLDPDLAGAYDIINDPESTLSFDQFLEAAERTREAYGTAFHGGLQVTDKGIRRTGQAKRVAKQRRQARGFAGGAGDLTGIPPEVILFDAALDAARDLQKRQTDPNYAIQTGDQKRRGRSGKPGQIGGRNAGRVASETVDPSRVSEILARRAVGGPGNGWETLKKEGYTAAEVSVAKSRIGANNPKVVSNKDPRAPGLANVTLDEETLEGGVRTRHFTHIGPEAPALTAAGGQGMFRTEPTADRPQPRDLDRPGIDPASLIGGGKSDTSRYGGRRGRGPFQKWMDRQRDLEMSRNRPGGAARFRFAEGGLIDFLEGGGVPPKDLRAFFGKKAPDPIPRAGSRARTELDQRYRTGLRAREAQAKKPPYQQGKDSKWAAISAAARAEQPFCSYCGTTTGKLTLDHIISPELGGAMYHKKNLAVACDKCNSQKNKEGFNLPGSMGGLASVFGTSTGRTEDWIQRGYQLVKDRKKGIKRRAEGGRTSEEELDRLFGDRPGMWYDKANEVGGGWRYAHERLSPEERERRNTESANAAYQARFGYAHRAKGGGTKDVPGTKSASSVDSLEDKLRRMADQSVSPNEAKIARAKLRARGVAGYAEGGGGNVKWGGLASSTGGIKSATMVGERGPEIMVEGHNGKAEVIPSHKIAGFMDGMAEGGLQFRQAGGAAYPYGRGIRATGPGARGTTLGGRMAGAAGAAEAGGTASSTLGSDVKVYVTNWPTGLSGAAGGGAAGAAVGGPAVGHAAAPGAGPAAAPGAGPAAGPGPAFAPGPVPGGAGPGAPAPGGPRPPRARVSPLGRVESRERGRQSIEDFEGRIGAVRAGISESLQLAPVRALSVAFGQVAQTLVGGRAGILSRSRQAAGFAGSAQRSATDLAGIVQQRREFAQGVRTRTLAGTAPTTEEVQQLRDFGAAERRQRALTEERTGRAEVAEKAVMTPGQAVRAQAVGLGGIIGGTAVFSAAIAAFSTASAAASTALEPLVQTMAGWPSTIEKVTGAIRDSILAAGGQVRAGVAAAVAPSGISAAYLDSQGRNLAATGMYRAAGAASQQALEISRAASAGPGGLYGGIGGFLGTGVGTELFGGQAGVLENTAARLKTRGIQQSVPNPLAPVQGKVVENTVAAGTQFAEAIPNIINDVFGALNPESKNFLKPGAFEDERRAAGAALQEGEVKDLNKDLKEAAAFAGDVSKSFELLTGATDDQKKAMIDSAAAISSEAKARAEEMARVGVAVVGPNRANLTGKQFGQYAEQQAQGGLFQDPELLLRAREPQRRAQAFAISANAAFRRNEDIPAQFGLQQLTRPLGRIGAGYDTSNLSAQARKDQADSAKSQKSIAESTEKGVAAMENIVSRIDNPSYAGGLGTSGEGPQKGATGGRVGPALTQFRSLVGRIGGLGTQIQGKVDTVAQEQATLQAHEYAEQIRLSTRSLGDAKDLWAAINGNSSKTVGGLQGQNILLDRQNQLLGRRQQRLAFKSEDIGFKMSDLQIQSQNLGFQQSQRQINFNKAVAGFAAPGSTPEERAARINEAKLEADFAQKQLDLQIAIAEQGRQQLKIAKEQAGISRAQFGNQVQQQDNQYAITREEAKRAVDDIKNALGLLEEGHKVTIDTASAEEAIANLQKEQGLLVDQAEDYLTQGQEIRSQVLSDVTDLMAATGKGFSELVGNVQTAWSRAFKSAYRDFLLPVSQVINALGGGGGGYNRQGPGTLDPNKNVYADGIIGSTAGATQFMAGEAGREHVVVLRNATEGTLMGLGGKGGGGGVNVGGVTIVVSGTKEMDEAKLAEMVVERMARKLAMLGV